MVVQYSHNVECGGAGASTWHGGGAANSRHGGGGLLWWLVDTEKLRTGQKWRPTRNENAKIHVLKNDNKKGAQGF